MTEQGRNDSIERVDVKTGFLCNNRCLFCVQGDKRDIYGNKTTQEVRDTLDSARQVSDSIVFTGGEVTIRKDFLDLVRYARELGFRVIQIQTNGRMLAYRKFCQETIDAGANEFSPALHGHTEELHDYLTCSKGSYRQTLQSIINLKALGQTIITNTVITRSNFRHLADIARLLLDLRVDQYQLAFVHPTGSAAKWFSSVVPRMTLIEPHVKNALALGVRRGVPALTEAIPYCFMGGFERCVAERYIPRTRIFDAGFVVDDYTQFRLAEGKAHGPGCRECSWHSVCEGPWREYPEHYGWDEFVPRNDRCLFELPEDHRT